MTNVVYLPITRQQRQRKRKERIVMQYPTYLELQEGIWSPRDREYGYRTFDYFSDEKLARKEARKWEKEGRAFRLIRSVVLIENNPGEPAYLRKEREEKEARQPNTTT